MESDKNLLLTVQDRLYYQPFAAAISDPSSTTQSDKEYTTHLQNAHTDTKIAHRQFDEIMEELAKLDAGKYSCEPDQPMNDFNAILGSTAHSPIENEDHLRILRKGIAYLMATEAGAPLGSIEEAMGAAMQQAIDTAPGALQGALLALMRHQLRGKRIHPLNA